MLVFIIDDDPLNLFITETVLLTEGVVKEVKCFLSATEALEEFKPENVILPEIVFLDLNMPVMNGWEFLDIVSSRLLLPNTKCGIFILTSSIDKADIARAKQYPVVSGFMHKPISSEDMQRALDYGALLHSRTN